MSGPSLVHLQAPGRLCLPGPHRNIWVSMKDTPRQDCPAWPKVGRPAWPAPVELALYPGPADLGVKFGPRTNVRREEPGRTTGRRVAAPSHRSRALFPFHTGPNTPGVKGAAPPSVSARAHS